ncbi:hypothetical protein EYF80_035919 [Liparis tanakae]|uniref:Uncharacterized protein n=1 Tax=Liparis tanakae TaxID=230148 RepID=A0A4Z2GJW6_9TELE|nr:hypothetical protein EYF80_035919 [Liparis tanakae]
MVRAIRPSAIVRWNKYTSEGVSFCLLVPITHPTNRFPGSASRKMAMRRMLRVKAAVAAGSVISHCNVSGSTTFCCSVKRKMNDKSETWPDRGEIHRVILLVLHN